MRHWIIAWVIFAGASAASAAPDIDAIIDTHILAGYRQLEDSANGLATAARADCTPSSPALVAAYHEAFDAWIRVSHLRFGPSERDDRAFALAFWPDPRGSTPKALGSLLRDEDPVVHASGGFRSVSIAARGFHALEFLLFDTQFAKAENPQYHCALVQAVTADIATISSAILNDWEGGYAMLMRTPGDDTYRSHAETARQLFTALSTGVEFTAQMRLGRPLGTFDRPRPTQAEAWRSNRSLRHVVLSLASLRRLASGLSEGDDRLLRAFDDAISRAEALDDPVFAGVSDPQARIRVEVLKQKVEVIQHLLREDLGPQLGVAAGFNALDGD